MLHSPFPSFRLHGLALALSGMLMAAPGPARAALPPPAAALAQAANLDLGSTGTESRDSSSTTGETLTTAALEGIRLAALNAQAVERLGPHELQILVTPLTAGVETHGTTTRTMWVLRQGVFLGRADGRTGLQMYIRDQNRTMYNPKTNRYHRWIQPAPEPPISPEGQGKYLMEISEYQGHSTHSALGPVIHLRTPLPPDEHMDFYLDPATHLLLRSERVGTTITIREDMAYRPRPELTDADLIPPLPSDAEEVQTAPGLE